MLSLYSPQDETLFLVESEQMCDMIYHDGLEGYMTDAAIYWEKQNPAHPFFVPSLVGGRPAHDVVDDVIY